MPIDESYATRIAICEIETEADKFETVFATPEDAVKAKITATKV